MPAAQAMVAGRPGVRLAVIALTAALLAALLAGLGVWQLQRLAWKQELLARVERARSGEPQPAPGPAQWPELSTARDEYRRIEVRGRYAHPLGTRVRAITVLGSGYWLLTPLLTDDGWWLLVNRGFVPPALPGGGAVAIDEPPGAQQVVGLLRFSEPGGSLLQSNQPAQDRWYARDVAAIAAARGIGPAARPGQPVAPYFVDAVATAAPASPPGGWPRPGLTVLSFSNNHLGYALTWFALAAMVVGGAILVLRFEWRRRGAGAGSVR